MSRLAWIRDRFTGGTLNASGEWAFGDLGPGDIIAHVVFDRLRSDATLATVFGEGFDLVSASMPFFGKMPRLQVYHGPDQEDARPTELTRETINLHIDIVWDPLNHERLLAAGEASAPFSLDPTISTLEHHVKQLLRNNPRLPVTLAATGGTCNLVNANPAAGRTSELPVQQEQGGAIRMVREIEWLYPVNIDLSTGRIANIVDAGG